MRRCRQHRELVECQVKPNVTKNETKRAETWRNMVKLQIFDWKIHHIWEVTWKMNEHEPFGWMISMRWSSKLQEISANLWDYYQCGLPDVGILSVPRILRRSNKKPSASGHWTHSTWINGVRHRQQKLWWTVEKQHWWRASKCLTGRGLSVGTGKESVYAISFFRRTFRYSFLSTIKFICGKIMKSTMWIIAFNYDIN